MTTHPVLVFLRLELADALRSRWVAFTCVLYAVLGLACVWLGLRESTVLGFTGLSRALLNLANAVIVAVPLLVLVATHSAVVRGRSNGFCELMLAQPVRRASWFLAVLGARLLVLVGPFIVLLVGSLVASRVVTGEGGIGPIAFKCLAVCSALVFGFVGVGMLISAASPTVERAMVLALVAFVTTSALHDVMLISVLLRTALPPYVVFILAALNPSEAARVGILASVDSELSVLGPVGFWLANALGPVVALAVAVVWPMVIGLVSNWTALRIFRRSDLVI